LIASLHGRWELFFLFNLNHISVKVKTYWSTMFTKHKQKLTEYIHHGLQGTFTLFFERNVRWTNSIVRIQIRGDDHFRCYNCRGYAVTVCLCYLDNKKWLVKSFPFFNQMKSIGKRFISWTNSIVRIQRRDDGHFRCCNHRGYTVPLCLCYLDKRKWLVKSFIYSWIRW
jgi:hypothetical protein